VDYYCPQIYKTNTFGTRCVFLKYNNYISFGQTYSFPFFGKCLEKINYTKYCIESHMAFYVIVVILPMAFLKDAFISVVIPTYFYFIQMPSIETIFGIFFILTFP
jgi:hypothetical protein